MAEPAQNQNPDKGDLKRIRTFQNDVEEMLQHSPVSKASIAIAESEKRIKQETQDSQSASSPFQNTSKVFRISSGLPLTSHWNTRLIALVTLLILFLGGIGIGAFFFFKDAEQAVSTEQGTQIPESAAVTLEGRESRAGTLKAIWSVVSTLSVPQNELRTIPVKLGIAPITTVELFAKLETSAPAPLTRALGTAPTLGVHGFRGGQPFLLFSVSSYDYAFAGMLDWEQNLLGDIGPLFGISPREILRNVGSTTTEALGNTIAVKDVILRNKDVRAVFDPQGAIIFLYSFIDKQTLVFTTNEDTLKILMSNAGGGRLR